MSPLIARLREDPLLWVLLLALPVLLASSSAQLATVPGLVHW